jgi:hypothetical protein
MSEERRIVDDRTFLLGLDKFYRDAMKRHERSELLLCARRVAAALNIPPETGPVEGYYAEDRELTEYFQLVRALQWVGQDRTPAVAFLPEFQRLLDVTSAPLYGKAIWSGKLLPTGRDALSQALADTQPDWSGPRLTESAYKAAEALDDFSLVGLAARAQDPVVLTATRESVVLYAEVMCGSALQDQPPKYVWNVNKELADQAGRFIDAFGTLFGEELPPPDPTQAARYWHACEDNVILGRCVRLGYNDAVSPVLQYHWAICYGDDGTLVVQEFWHPDVWTTERYRAALQKRQAAF